MAGDRATEEPWVYGQVDRVRFADLDARGHLNNVAMLAFFEATRIAYLQDLFPEMDPTDPGSADVILASQHIDYRAPAELRDELLTRLRPTEVKEKSFRLDFEVLREPDGPLVAEGHGIYVGYDYEQGAGRPLDATLAGRLREAAGEEA